MMSYYSELLHEGLKNNNGKITFFPYLFLHYMKCILNLCMFF